MRIAGRCRAAIVIGLLPITLAQAQSAPPTDPAAWVPAEALCYLGVTNVTETWEEFKKTSAYRLASDPAASEVIPTLNATVIGSIVRQTQIQLARLLDLPPTDLRNPFDEPLAVYLTAEPGPGRTEIRPGLVAQVGDATLMRQYYELVVQKLKRLARHEPARADPHTIDCFVREPVAAQPEEEFEAFDAAGEEELWRLLSGWLDSSLDQHKSELLSVSRMPQRLAMCLTTDRLIVAGSVEQVQSVLRGVALERNLAQAELHQALLSEFQPLGSVRLVVDLPRVIEAAKRAKSRTWVQLGRKLDELAAGSLRGLIGHCSLEDPDCESRIELALLASEPRRGVAGLLNVENRPTGPPPEVSADSCLYAACHLDLVRLLEEIQGRGVARRGPAGSPVPPSTSPQPSTQRLDFGGQLLNVLKAPLTLSLRDAHGPDRLFVLATIGHRDRATMTELLTGPLTAGWFQPREVGQTQVFDITPLPALAIPPGLSAGLTTDRLLLGSRPAVEAALVGRPREALADTGGWRKAAACLPTESWFVLYLDSPRLLQAALGPEPEAPPSGQSSVGSIGQMIVSALRDASGGSPPDSLSKYTATTACTISTTPSGLKLVAIRLRPEN